MNGEVDKSLILEVKSFRSRSNITSRSKKRMEEKHKKDVAKRFSSIPKIKPCPKCDKRNFLLLEEKDVHLIQCNNCKYKGGYSNDRILTIKRWNRERKKYEK